MIEVRLLVHGAGRPNIESPDDKRIFVEVHIYWSPTSKSLMQNLPWQIYAT